MIKKFKDFADFSSIDYSEYVAESIEKNNYGWVTGGGGSDGSRHTCGYISVPNNHTSYISVPNNHTSCNIVNDPASKFVGNSRIDGSSWYSNKNEMINVQPSAAINNPGIFNDGTFNNGSWHPGTFDKDDNIGWWTKEKNKELSTFEKWSIGIGVASLIVGIITALVMFF